MNGLIDSVYSFNLFSSVPDFVSHILALFFAALTGSLLGWERERKGKPAGIRTFALVCLGSCLFSLIGREVNASGDLGRIIGQIISGVGFLGAGAVIREGHTNSGLTTAAGIWVSSGLGVVFGLGFLPFGLLMTGVVYALLRLNVWLERFVDGPCDTRRLVLRVTSPDGRARYFFRVLLEEEPRLRWSEERIDKDVTEFVLDLCSAHRKHRSFIREILLIDGVEVVHT